MKHRRVLLLCFAGLFGLVWPAAFADGVAEMQKKLQNPLANIKAIMTDNVIGFDSGNTDGTSYGFQLQPVYAIDFPGSGFTFINRAVIPIMGLEPGTDTRITGQPAPGETDSVWGLGDTVYQGFFAPHTDAGWKWGAGVAGVLDGNFNTMILQPMFFYTVGTGKSIAYSAVISSDWKADSSNQWTVPLGLSWNQTLDMGGGNGFDYMIGPYYNVARPDGAAGWQLRFGINWLFP